MPHDGEIGNPQAIPETEKAWLAGVIEGDGSLGMGFQLQNGYGKSRIFGNPANYDEFEKSKNGKGYQRFAVKPSIQFSNQDGLLIESVCNLFIRICKKQPLIRESKGQYENSRSVLSVGLYGLQAVFDVLEAILPYLHGEKQARARLLFRFISSRFARHKHLGRGNGASKVPYNSDELLIIRQFYETGRRKGGKTNPEIGRVLTDYERAVANLEEVEAMKI